MCSKYVNSSRHNSQHNLGWGGGYDHSMSMRIFTLIMDKIFTLAPKTKRKISITLIIKPSHTNCVFISQGKIYNPYLVTFLLRTHVFG